MIKYPFELSTTQQNHVGWLDVRQNDTGHSNSWQILQQTMSHKT